MKLITQISLVVMMTILLTAMVFAGGQKEKKSGVGTDEKVTISYLFFPQVKDVPGFEDVSVEFGDWEAYIAEQFMKENPGVIVETQLLPWDGGTDKVNVAIASGDPPDLVFDYLGRTGAWYLQGAAVAADDVFPSKLTNDIQQSFKDVYMIDGKLHALPGFTWNINLNINVGLLRKYGYIGEILNGPGNAYSDEEFVEFLTKVKNTVPNDVWPFIIQCGGIQGDYNWWEFFWGFGGHLYDKDGSITDDPSGIVKGYKFIQSLREKGLVAPGIASMSVSEPRKMWGSAKAIVSHGSKATANTMKGMIEEGKLDFAYDVMPVPFPSDNGDKGFTANGPTGFIVFAKDAAKQQAVSDFVEFSMQQKYWKPWVTASGQFPVQKSMADANLYAGDEYQEVVRQMMAKFPSGNFALASPNYQKIRTALANCGQLIFSDRKSPEDAVEDFLEEVRKLEE